MQVSSSNVHYVWRVLSYTQLGVYVLRNLSICAISKFPNCAIMNCAFVNSDLGLVPRPVAAVTQLGWKLHYSPAAVFQPLHSLRRSRSQILRRLTAPNQLCTRICYGLAGLSRLTLRFYSGFLALTLGCPLTLTFLALFPGLPCVASSRA